MTSDQLQDETTEVLQRLVRFNTVNPPGNERPAIEYLDALPERGRASRPRCWPPTPDRPNLVADLRRRRSDGPTLCLLGHVDTVLADADGVDPRPVVGRRRRRLPVGPRRDRHEVPGRRRGGRRRRAGPRRAGGRRAGTLKLVFTADEETGGEVGAQLAHRRAPGPGPLRLLLNEGGGESFRVPRPHALRRVLRREGDLPLQHHRARRRRARLAAPDRRQRAAEAGPGAPAAGQPAGVLRGDRGAGGAAGAAWARIPTTPARRSRGSRDYEPRLRTLVEPMLGVTLTPTMASASEQMNVIPSRAQIMVDCRVPPGLGEEAARRRIAQVLGEETDELADRVHRADRRQRVAGRQATLMSAIDRLGAGQRPGRRRRCR